MPEKTNNNQENIRPVGHCLTTIWKSLLINGLSLGVLMGILEVLWTYLLPVIFPERSHSLPDASLLRFFVIAIIADTIFVLAVCVLFGIFISLFYKVRKPLCLKIFRSTSIRFFLIAGILSYLYRGNLFIYFLLGNDPRRNIAVISGIVIIFFISLILAWLLNKPAIRFGGKTVFIAWLLTAILFVVSASYHYNRYTSSLIASDDLPMINSKDKPNILLVTIDTLRADHVGCYGNKIVKTPTLDSLAKDGHLFENAFCQVPYTTPSHCSIMTSLYMSQHGAINGLPMKEGLLTIAEILKFNKYDTAAFVSCGMVRSKNTRLHRGFDYYEDSFSRYTPLLRLDELQFLLTINALSGLENHELRGDIPTHRLIKWLSKKRTSPFFCWLHYFDPHYSYDAPEPYKNMYAGMIDENLPYQFERMRYAGEVTYADSQFAHVIDHLKQNNLYDNTMIIVTADHGEAFGEKHGNIIDRRHGRHLYDPTVHVPLIIKLPKEKQKDHRIKNLVQLIDIAPTILDHLNATSPEAFKGKSLKNLINDNKSNMPSVIFAETTPPLSGGHLDEKLFQERTLKSIRSAETKYIENINRQSQELYDMVSDPKETSNLYLEEPEQVQTCQEEIIKTLGNQKIIQPEGYDSRVIEQLRSLGYIGADPENGN
ncbi:MAG: sulfatase-like hydrolase/transferase [Sedimentisphaerales bacterium]|nr:sulfatase-like hydrolase/transferase [Sedimentisphaerales bacterium]